jgi:F0F1-type ATP synthase alpha subunit
LAKVANGEMINFCIGNENIYGLVLNLESTCVSAIVLGSDIQIKPGLMFIVNMF